MNWINSGPKVFPDNMRAGRVLYYSAIPTTIPDTGGTLDQKFWRAYIDYVIGAGNQTEILYGQNTTAYGTTRITAKASLTANPAPYMHYNDNPIHPRLNFWFGPVSFLSFYRTIEFTGIGCLVLPMNQQLGNSRLEFNPPLSTLKTTPMIRLPLSIFRPLTITMSQESPWEKISPA